MSDSNFKITISAVDQASPVLKNIGATAEKTSSVLDGFSAKGLDQLSKQADVAGDAMGDLGKETLAVLKQIESNTAGAAKGIDRVGESAESAGRKSAGFRENLDKIGAGAGAAVSGLSFLGQMYVEQERQLDSLGRQYGASADDIIAFTEEIQNSTRYSNDAAREAAGIAATLANQYGLSMDQIQQVLSRSADLAQTSGLSLADASERVVAAIRGEAEAAERLGLTLNDANVARYAASQGIDNYSTGLDEAGRAQVRLNLFLEQSAFATGAAGDAAQTAAGQAQQFVNQLQDAAQSLGGFIGPGAEVASVLGSYAIAAPLAGAGLGKLAQGAKTAVTALAGLRVAGLALSVLAGPVGVIAAAVGLGAIAWQGWTNRTEEAESAARAAAEGVDALTEAIRAQAAAGQDTTWANEQLEAFKRLTGAAEDYDRFRRLQASVDLGRDTLFGDGVSAPNLPFGRDLATQGELIAQQEEYLRLLRESTTLNEDQIRAAESAITAVTSYQGVNAEQVRRNLELILSSFQPVMEEIRVFDPVSGIERTVNQLVLPNADMLIAQLTSLETNMGSVGLVTTDANGNIVSLAEASNQAAADVETLSEALAKLFTAGAGDTEFGRVLADQILLINDAMDMGVVGSELEGVIAWREQLILLRDMALVDPNLTMPQRIETASGYTALIEQTNEYIAGAIDEAATATQAGFESWFGVTEEGGSRVAEAAAAAGGAMASAIAAAAAEEAAARQRHLELVRAAYDEEIQIHEARADSILQLQDDARNQINPGTVEFGFLDGLDEMVAARELTQTQADGITAAFDRLNSMGLSTLEMFDALTTAQGYAGSSSVDFAIGMENAATALGSANSLVIETTANMLGLVEASAGLANDLFGGDPADGLGPLVDLLDQGLITQEEFNTARDAGLGLLEQERLATLAINEVRAGQLPYLEEQSAAYTTWLQQLAEMDDAEARRILYLQDANAQQLLLNTSQLIYQASIGQIPDQIVSDLVLSRAEWDEPYRQTLIEAGYITENPITGELNLVIGEDQMTSTLADLNTTLEDLVYWLMSVGDQSEDAARKLEGLGRIDLSNLRKPMGGGTGSINDDTSLDGTDLGAYGSPTVTPSLSLPAGWSALDLGELPPLQLEIDAENARAETAAAMADLASMVGEDIVAYITGDNDDAMGRGRETEDFYGGINGLEAMLFARGDNGDALSKLGEADSVRGAFDGTEAWTYQYGENAGALAAIAVANAARNGYDGTTGTANLYANDYASNTINALASRSGGVVAEMFVNIYEQRISKSGYFSNGGVVGYANGGVIPAAADYFPGYANGGIPAAANGMVLVGEAGPELVTLPGGSLITPSPASQAIAERMVGNGVTINFNGPVTGLDEAELTMRITREISGVMASAWRREAASQGMGWN